jgi:hypothetical protein
MRLGRPALDRGRTAGAGLFLDAKGRRFTDSRIPIEAAVFLVDMICSGSLIPGVAKRLSAKVRFQNQGRLVSAEEMRAKETSVYLTKEAFYKIFQSSIRVSGCEH